MSVDLAVSVVSYRTPLLLRQCLAALDTERHNLNTTVTVVDNASGDDSPDLVEREFPWVQLVRNTRNVGFGAAHNQALRGSAARHLLVLNSDATPAQGALRLLVDFLDAHPDAAVVGPRLRYPDGSIQPSRRRFPTLATFFCESTQVQRFWPHNPLVRRFYMADQRDDVAQDVDWLTGACLCVRARAAADVGLFDERFFMYSEELDWCRRFRAAGWRVVYLPAAEVQHHASASADLDLAARDKRFQTSRLRYVEKWHGPAAARALRTYVTLEYVLRAIEETVKLGLGSRPEVRRARLAVIRAGLRATLSG